MNEHSNRMTENKASAFSSEGLEPLKKRSRKNGRKSDVVVRAARPIRATRAEVDFEAIQHNFRVIDRKSGNRKVIAVVKADAYGHGLIPSATALEEAGAKAFGVALAEEALALRDAGVEGEILVLNGIYGRAHAEVIAAQLTPVVYHLEQLISFSAVATRPLGVHLKIDSGMHRLGVSLSELPAMLDAFDSFPALRIEGVMTHLATADSDPMFVQEQLTNFHQAVSLVRLAGHSPTEIHALNTAGFFAAPAVQDTAIRPGIGLFGFRDPHQAHQELRRTLRLLTTVADLRWVEEGESVGYDRAYRSKKRELIATVPIGYGDGLFRAAGNRAEVSVCGVRCPLVGRVGMDLSAVDVTGVPGIAMGSEVVVFGDPAKGEPGIEALARATGTLPYEVMTNLAPRIPRHPIASHGGS